MGCRVITPSVLLLTKFVIFVGSFFNGEAFYKPEQLTPIEKTSKHSTALKTIK